MTSSPAPPSRLFERVLVANRGEIAIRVLRTLRELGIESVAICSDADAAALHTTYADHVVCVGGELPGDSYLRQDLVLEAARTTGAEAIHPGYGFLAENADFARACASAGITFIGPPPGAIDAMGSKTASRELMQRAGVPIVPGSTEAVATLAAAAAGAEEIGYPVAVKARSGGGGKGFRVALDASELPGAFEGASREGERYFSDGAVYLERYLHDPRHVEVQLLADTHGAIIHLGERDCSVQRRHQKLIEECPGPHTADPEFTARLREQLGAIAVGAARAVGYTSAGTIECLLGDDGTPYFLEMNTRVQVEHTVTEMVTGVDIVAEQLRIAAGLPLSLRQEDVTFRGHSLECRINAEDAGADFRPSSGPVTHWREPGGLGVRVDSGYRAGSVVSPFYDTLLAKLVTWGADRDDAIRRMRRALDEFEVGGVETLLDFHRAVMASAEFARGETCRDLVADPAAAIERLVLGDRRIVAPLTARVAGRAGVTATVDAGAEATSGLVPNPDLYTVEVDGHRFSVRVHDPATALPVAPPVRARTGTAGAAGDVVAPIPGNVLQVLVEPGQQVEAGDVVCILEAMKMENEIAAAAAGAIGEVAVAPGDAVAAGQLLLTIGVDGRPS